MSPIRARQTSLVAVRSVSDIISVYTHHILSGEYGFCGDGYVSPPASLTPSCPVDPQ